MSRTIEFVTADGTTLGAATLDDDGSVDCSTPAVEQTMASRRARIGDEKAFRYFETQWQNPYTRTRPA